MTMESKHQLGTDEIMKMCNRLAYKYPQHAIRDDLKSEALLAIYERLEVNPEEHPAYLFNVAREAMSDFCNLKNRTVVVPANKTTRAVAANREVPRLTNYSDSGIDAIYDALQPTKGFDKDKSGKTEDCTGEYEARDFIDKGLDLLTEREKSIVHMRYYMDMSQLEVSESYSVSQKTVSLWEEVALKKLSEL